jgi:hypothetical protein
MLEGIRVIELGDDPVGEMVGRLPGHMGADVITVEPPEGSPTRTIGPFAHDNKDSDHSLTFRYYNTNKQSVVVDYRSFDGQAELLELVAGADICTTTFQASEWRQLGMTIDELLKAQPDLIALSITPFGLDGPWADWASRWNSCDCWFCAPPGRLTATMATSGSGQTSQLSRRPCPRSMMDIASRALQVHGSLGVSDEMPFAAMVLEWFHMGLVDGATEVHKTTLARQLLKDYKPSDDLFPTRHLLKLRAQAREKYADTVKAV